MKRWSGYGVTSVWKESDKAEEYLAGNPDIILLPRGAAYCESSSVIGKYYKVDEKGNCSCPWARQINSCNYECKHTIAARMVRYGRKPSAAAIYSVNT